MRYFAYAMFVTLVCLVSDVAMVRAQEAPASSPEATVAYDNAGQLQNNGVFEEAAKDWESFLAKFPKDPLAPKALHYLGVCRMQLKDFPAAIAAFDKYQKENEKGDLLEDALLNLGWCRFTSAGPDAARFGAAADTFATLLKKFPKGKFVDQALFFQGESLYNQGKKEEALQPYSQLVKEQEKSNLRDDALYALAVTQEELGKFAEAGTNYDLFLKDYPNSDLVTEVRMRKAETILQAGDYATAEKMLTEVVAVPNFPMADHAQSRRAFCLIKLNQLVEAGNLYAKIVNDYPKSDRVNIVDAALSAGRCYYRAEKFEEASKWFTYLVEGNNNASPEAAHWQCRILLRDKQPDKALALADRFIVAAAKSDFLPALKIDRADALYELPERRADSIAEYAQIATDHPQHASAPQALYNAAFTALEIKHYEQGTKYAEAFAKSYASDTLLPNVKYVAAECLLQQEKRAEAETAYKELLAAHPQHADVDIWRNRLALAAYLQKKYAEVVALLSPVVEQIKDANAKAESWYLIGISQFYADQFPEAERALLSSIAASPQWRQADETAIMLSRTLRKENKTADAIATINKVFTDFPSSKLLDQAQYRLGEFQYAAEDFPAAAASYEAVLSKYPESSYVPFALYGKGWSHLKRKEFAPAAEAFTNLLSKYPQHSLANEALFARAMSRRQEGNFAGALEDANAFLASAAPGDAKADALYERGLAEVGTNKLEAAVTTFEGLLKDFPKYPSSDKVLYELGWAYKSLEKAEPALAVFARLATDFPESPLVGEAYFHLGEDQYGKKQYAEALKSYTLSKEKSPAGELGEKSTYKLGWANFQLKQYDASLKEFGEQLEKYPQGPLAADALFMKGESLFKLQKYAEALPVFRDSLQVKLSNPAMEVLRVLHGGQSASQLKQWDVAVKLLGEIPQNFADSPYLAEAHYELGWARQNSGKTDDALTDYTTAAEKSRGEVGARARFMLGELYFEQKKYNEAIREFQRGMYTYGGDAAPPEVKNWQAKSGYEAGRCSEVQIAAAADAAAKTKFVADARKFYTFVVEKHAQSEVAPLAKSRIEVLSKL